MQSLDDALNKLKKSRFRSSFHLSRKDIEYINDKGKSVIREHAVTFVEERLCDAYPKNDGKQTPMRGHPVFVAMHACACCCRGCLYKWYKVKKGEKLSDSQKEKIVNLLMAWIDREISEK